MRFGVKRIIKAAAPMFTASNAGVVIMGLGIGMSNDGISCGGVPTGGASIDCGGNGLVVTRDGRAVRSRMRTALRRTGCIIRRVRSCGGRVAEYRRILGRLGPRFTGSGTHSREVTNVRARITKVGNSVTGVLTTMAGWWGCSACNAAWCRWI